MKKVICVMGIVCAIMGFVLMVSANIEINTNSHYTWERPYTSYEKKILTTKYAGIVLLISGATDIILTVVSTVYTARTVQNVVDNQSEFLVCTSCRCKIIKGTVFCPNCGHKFN